MQIIAICGYLFVYLLWTALCSVTHRDVPCFWMDFQRICDRASLGDFKFSLADSISTFCKLLGWNAFVFLFREAAAESGRVVTLPQTMHVPSVWCNEAEKLQLIYYFLFAFWTLEMMTAGALTRSRQITTINVPCLPAHRIFKVISMLYPEKPSSEGQTLICCCTVCQTPDLIYWLGSCTMGSL